MSNRELTDLQAQALELRDNGEKLSWTEIGERMGVGRSIASNAYRGAIKKAGALSELPNEGVLELQFQKFVKGLRGVTSDVLLELLETGLLKALWRLANDSSVFARLDGKELGLLAGNLIERRQLLRGEPTKIISVEDRRHWDELSVALLQEVKRRGLDITLPPSQYHEEEPPALLNNG